MKPPKTLDWRAKSSDYLSPQEEKVGRLPDYLQEEFFFFFNSLLSSNSRVDFELLDIKGYPKGLANN